MARLRINAWREPHTRKTNTIVETRSDLSWAQVGGLLAHYCDDYPRVTVFDQDAGHTILVYDKEGVF